MMKTNNQKPWVHCETREELLDAYYRIIEDKIHELDVFTKRISLSPNQKIIFSDDVFTEKYIPKKSREDIVKELIHLGTKYSVLGFLRKFLGHFEEMNPELMDGLLDKLDEVYKRYPPHLIPASVYRKAKENILDLWDGPTTFYSLSYYDVSSNTITLYSKAIEIYSNKNGFDFDEVMGRCYCHEMFNAYYHRVCKCLKQRWGNKKCKITSESLASYFAYLLDPHSPYAYKKIRSWYRKKNMPKAYDKYARFIYEADNSNEFSDVFRKIFEDGTYDWNDAYGDIIACAKLKRLSR